MMQWITKEENNGSIKIKTINIIQYQNGGTENNRNNRKKTNQTGIKDENTCYACCIKRHK